VNLIHRWYCSSGRWSELLQGRIIPWVLGDADLGDDVLEIGPGPGVATDWLRPKVGHLTAIEIDHALAESLRQRLEGTNVTVVEGDAAAMPFEDGRFSAAVSFTMLHHVPSVELQDRLLAETCRVLRPGALFAGSDSTPSLTWNLYHVFDTRVPVDPDGLPARLEAAGFVEPQVERYRTAFRFRARKP
jgi:SAM-dependent methyltransferase